MVKGKVRNLTNYGAFIEIEEGIDGLLHVSDMSWTRKIGHPSEVVEKGQEVECKVLSVDQERRRIALGLKQLDDDPWATDIPNRYQPGQLVKGKVTKITNFGVFVGLEDGLEGLLHISELADHKVENPEDVVKVGDEIEVKILRVDTDERKIGLSRKRVEWAEEDEAAAEAATARLPARAGRRAQGRRRRRAPARCSRPRRDATEDAKNRQSAVSRSVGTSSRSRPRALLGRSHGVPSHAASRTTRAAVFFGTARNAAHIRRTSHRLRTLQSATQRVDSDLHDSCDAQKPPTVDGRERSRGRTASTPPARRSRSCPHPADGKPHDAHHHAASARARSAVQTPLETYLREINETACSPPSEEKELATRIGQGDTRGPRPHGPRQPAAGGQHRPRLHRQGPGPAGPDRRRQPRPAPGRRRLRPGDGHAVQHLRQLLDQAVDQAGPDQHGQDDPHPGLHGRAALEVAAGHGAADRRARPHADAGRDRPRARPAEEEAADHQEGDQDLQRHAADRPGRSRLDARRDGDGRAAAERPTTSWSRATACTT